MPVHSSHRPDIGSLVDRLSSPDPVLRDSAVARLVVIGQRSIPAVQALLGDDTAPTAARLGALRALAALSPVAALDAAAACVAGPEERIAFDAIDLLGDTLADAGRSLAADRALEHLTRLVLDTAIPTRRRLAMMEPLARLPVRLRQPVLDVLAAEGHGALAERAGQESSSSRGSLEQWTDEERLPASADVFADAVDAEGQRAALTTLRQLVDMARSRELTSSGPERDAWRRGRSQVHHALAQRGSTIALFDLRETLEQVADPVSANFLVAARLLADASCLDAVAARWVSASGDPWLRDQLEQVFRSIVGRARLRRDAAVLAKILKRLPAAGPLVATAPRKRPAP